MSERPAYRVTFRRSRNLRGIIRGDTVAIMDEHDDPVPPKTDTSTLSGRVLFRSMHGPVRAVTWPFGDRFLLARIGTVVRESGYRVLMQKRADADCYELIIGREGLAEFAEEPVGSITSEKTRLARTRRIALAREALDREDAATKADRAARAAHVAHDTEEKPS